MAEETLGQEIKEYWAELGPGLTAGAADDDPSGTITYLQAAAQYGLQLIWVAVFTYPLMAVAQEMCARIGIVSGRGLAANIRSEYHPVALYGVTALLFVANVFNIAADLAIMAAVTQLLLPKYSVGVLVLFFGFVSVALQIFTPYGSYARYLKYLTFALLSYVAVAFVVGLDWSEVLYHTLVPSITWSSDQLILLCAILGTTISPYLFFWQTSQEVEEEILRGQTSVAARRREVTPKTIRTMRTDVWSGMGFSNLIMFFIFATGAGTLYLQGITTITTVDEAARALASFGTFTNALFAIGIVGTGLIAVPVLAGSTAYALAESFGWKYGLYRKLKKATSFYAIIIVAMALGVIANLLRIDPIHGLIYAAVVNGIIAPFILFFVVRLSGNKRVMGEYVSGRVTSTVGWVTIVVMAVAGIAAILAFAF